MTPRAYVFPDPLWPHRNVCREKPWARNRAATSTSAERQVPTGSAAFRDCCSDSRSPAEAASTGAAANGCRGTGPSLAVRPKLADEETTHGPGRFGCGRRLEHLAEQRSTLGQGEHDEVADHQ